MYWFSGGWMFCGKGDSVLRMRLRPVPLCEKKVKGSHKWEPAMPDSLFLAESEDFRKRRQRMADPRQPEFFLAGESDPLDTPYRQDPHLAAYRMWYGAPEIWRSLCWSCLANPWKVVCFLSAGGRRAVDLMAANRGLVWLLGETYFEPGWMEAPEKAKDLCNSLHLKQRELLPRVGLPSEPWIARMLTKLTPEMMAYPFLSKLQELIKYPKIVKLLQHLTVISPEMLFLIRLETAPFLSYHFLMELWPRNDTGVSLDMMSSLLRDAAQHAQAGGRVPVFQHIRHLERWHWDELGSKGLHSILYPDPPFPGTKWIRPVTHSHLLQQESRVMRHCVMTYEKDVLRGQVAIYVLLHPQRATIGLMRNRDGTWRIFDFRLQFNRQPHTGSWETVETWLKQFQS